MPSAAETWRAAALAFLAALVLAFAITQPAHRRALSLDDEFHLGYYAEENRARSVAEVIALRHWQNIRTDTTWRPLPKLLWREIANPLDSRPVAWVTVALAACVAAAAAALVRQKAPEPLAIIAGLAPIAHGAASDVLLPFVGQADLMAAALIILAALAAVRGRGAPSLAAMALLAAAAFLCKESAPPAIGALPVLAFAWSRGVRRVRLRRAALVFAALLPALAPRLGGGFLLHGGLHSAAASGDTTGASASLFLLRPMVSASLLNPAVATQTDYSFLLQPEPHLKPQDWIGALAIALLVALVAWLAMPRRATRATAKELRSRRAALGAVGAAALFGALYSGVIPMGALAAGRFMLLPIAFLACALAVVAARLPRSITLPVGIAALAAGSVAVWQRAPEFRSGADLWKAEVRRRPHHGFAQTNLAAMLYQQGRLRDAQELAERAVADWPRHGEGWLSLGRIAAAAGDAARSGEALQRAAELLPGNPGPLVELGLHAARQRRWDDAIAFAERAQALAPDNREIAKLLERLRKDRDAAR